VNPAALIAFDAVIRAGSISGSEVDAIFVDDFMASIGSARTGMTSGA
jgi:hypothetical protein